MRLSYSVLDTKPYLDRAGWYKVHGFNDTGCDMTGKGQQDGSIHNRTIWSRFTFGSTLDRHVMMDIISVHLGATPLRIYISQPATILDGRLNDAVYNLRGGLNGIIASSSRPEM
jgi:hypothetical protein